MIQTPKTFQNFFLKSGVIQEQDQILLESKFSNKTPIEIIKLVRQHADAYIDFSLESVEFYSVYSHQIAAASLYLARLSLGISPVWPDELAYMTSASLSDFSNIVDKIFAIFKEKRVDLAKDIEEYKMKIDNNNTNHFLNQFKKIFDLEPISILGQKQDFQSKKFECDEDNPPLKRTNCKKIAFENLNDKKIDFSQGTTNDGLTNFTSNIVLKNNDMDMWFE